MASSNACWGIELGAGSIKAIKLVRDGDGARVADFVVLPHKKVLSTPDLDQDEAMRVAIGALTSQYDLSKARIAISAPGHSAFARFAKLPPVEPKKIAGIVKYEAIQQIPFPLEEVEWDYQTFAREDSPDVEVGILAMTRERVMQKLNLCGDANLRPDILNLSPIAVFNAMAHDLPISDETEGTVLIDIGAVATDLIVADQGRVWVRTFPIGGHNFTEAIVSAFKLPYSKAEKLKREAEQSKHKKHIFQAMRPVFTDLAQEVQRSIAFYQQLHPESEIKRVIGFGETFRLIGLRKYLSQQLQIDVTRCERFKQLQVDGPAEADFQSATLSLATAYGLALQGLGMAAIDANLIPVSVIRESVWKRKTPVFVAAAVLALAAGGASFIRPFLDSQEIAEAQQNPALQQVNQVKQQGRQLRDAWQQVSQSAQIGFAAENIFRLFERRDLYATLVSDVAAVIQTAPPSQEHGFHVDSLRIDYETPTGGPPQWINVGGDGFRAPTRPGSSGGARSSGVTFGGGGPQTTNRPRGRTAGRQQQSQETVERRFGTFSVQLTVTSTHPDLAAFVDRTLLHKLNELAERDDAPYIFVAPSIEDIRIEEVSSDSGRGGRGDRSGQRPTTTPTRSGGSENTTLDALAPLPTVETADDDEGKYRYTISWQVSLKQPEKPISLDAEQGGQQAAATEVTP